MAKRLMKELDRVFDHALINDPTEARSAPPARLLRTGTILMHEWHGTTHHVTIVDDGFVWNGSTHRSLSSIARAITGTKWNGPRFFGMREADGVTRESRRG